MLVGCIGTEKKYNILENPSTQQIGRRLFCEMARVIHRKDVLLPPVLRLVWGVYRSKPIYQFLHIFPLTSLGVFA